MLGVGRGGPKGTFSAADAAASSLSPPTPVAAALRHRPRLTERQAWAVLTATRASGRWASGRCCGRSGRAAGSSRRHSALARSGPHRCRRQRRAPDVRCEGRGRDRGHCGGAGPALRGLEVPGLGILTTRGPGYPSRLRAIELPPHVLFVRGSVDALESRHAVAVVGTRRPTDAGRALAARIGGSLARAGATVVSASRSASTARAMPPRWPRAVRRWRSSGPATGGCIRTPTRGSLTNRRRRRGGRLGARAGHQCEPELVPASQPDHQRAGRRHGRRRGRPEERRPDHGRLGARAGSRPVHVPGGIDDPQAAGCLEWLHEFPGQAHIVPTIPQLIHDLRLFDEAPARLARPSLQAELIELGATARAIARELVRGSGTVDELVAATGHSVATALGALTMLESRGLATSAYGRYRPAGRLASAVDDGQPSG